MVPHLLLFDVALGFLCGKRIMGGLGA